MTGSYRQLADYQPTVGRGWSADIAVSRSRSRAAKNKTELPEMAQVADRGRNQDDKFQQSCFIDSFGGIYFAQTSEMCQPSGVIFPRTHLEVVSDAASGISLTRHSYTSLARASLM